MSKFSTLYCFKGDQDSQPFIRWLVFLPADISGPRTANQQLAFAWCCSEEEEQQMLPLTLMGTKGTIHQ